MATLYAPPHGSEASLHNLCKCSVPFLEIAACRFSSSFYIVCANLRTQIGSCYVDCIPWLQGKFCGVFQFWHSTRSWAFKLSTVRRGVERSHTSCILSANCATFPSAFLIGIVFCNCISSNFCLQIFLDVQHAAIVFLICFAFILCSIWTMSDSRCAYIPRSPTIDEP